jgi:hypothetical protein
MFTRIFLGVNTAGSKTDNLPPLSADVTYSKRLELPEPYGPHRAVMGIKEIYIFVIGTSISHLLNYLLHGAESFLRS